MRYTKQLIDRYKRFRNTNLLRHDYHAKYAFVGIGNHSMNNLYPVLAFLHVPLKYVCCKSADKLPLIERAYAGVHATTSLQEILADEEAQREEALEKLERILNQLGYCMQDTTRTSYLSMLMCRQQAKE